MAYPLKSIRELPTNVQQNELVHQVRRVTLVARHRGGISQLAQKHGDFDYLGGEGAYCMGMGCICIAPYEGGIAPYEGGIEA